jgi:tetratricopeptide (TPR) repeat protein
LIETTLGPYRIERELGSGGMGKVYAASASDGATVALKVVHPHLVADADALARFRREAAVGISIRHANVVATLAAGEDDGRQWLALEYVEGQTLHALQQELGTVPEELCRHVAHEVAAGLAAIHATGIVHRDMKPENVLITRDNVVKVMDLGVARGAEDDARITQTGAFVGSLQYAAPEQFGALAPRSATSEASSAKGVDAIDGRADLHALGVLFYELSTGANPYQDSDWRVVFQRVLKETPRRLGAVNPQISPFFEEVVHTLLAKDRDARFASAAELASVLEAGEDSPWWSARAKSIRGATRRALRRVKIPRETALVGRDVEMAKLRAAFEKAQAGDGHVVLIEGEAGIGKSRLVDEFVALLEREGEDLDFLYGSYPPGGAATASGAFTTAYREHFGELGSAPYLVPTPILVPAFDALLRGETTPPGVEPLTKDSLQTCIVHATRAIAAERVAVVLIDDLHFAPEEGRGLFASLAMAVPGHRVLLVGTSRPPLDEKWAANVVRLGHATRFAVGRLGARDLVALLRDALKSSHLAEELAVKIAEKTDGNPFFVFEVLRGLKDGQYLTQKADGTWATTRVLHEIRIPASIADMIQARVADLSDDERNLLEVAACIGFEFDPALVAAANGTPLLPTLRSFGQVEKTHRLVRSAGRLYRFDHHQVQEHLYAGLHEQVREQLHSSVAETLSARGGAASRDPASFDGALCVDLCEHFLRGAQGVKALPYLDPALAHLEKAYLNDAAVRLTERALAVPALLAGKERAEVCLRRARRLDLLGRRDAERAALDEAGALADAGEDPALRARVLGALGWHLHRVSRFAEAESSLRAALVLARAAGEKQVESGATGNLGLVFYALGRYAEAREHFERRVALAREIGDRRGESAATGNLSNVFQRLGRYAEAREHSERHVALARKMADVDGEAAGTNNLGNALSSLGHATEAREHYERSMALARRCGNRRSEANAIGNLGLVFHSLGRHAEAREHLERQRSLAQETGDRRAEARAAGNLGIVFDSLGRIAEARDHFERSLALARETGARQEEAVALDNIGSVHLRLGEPALARPRLEESVALCREIGARRDEGFAIAGLSEVADAEGDAGAALVLAAEALALRRTIGDGSEIADSLIAVASLRRRAGETESARSALEESLRIAREHGWTARSALALAILACLPGGAPRDRSRDGPASPGAMATAAVDALAAAGPDAETAGVRWLLWQATGDKAHLAAAKRLLDETLAKVPAEHHAAMLANVRVNREIAAAAEAGV